MLIDSAKTYHTSMETQDLPLLDGIRHVLDAYDG